MSWLDILIAAIFVIRAFFGWKQGAVKGVLFLLGSILGITLAGIFYKTLSSMLGFIPIEYAADVTAFILILAAIEIIITVPIRLLSSGVSALIPSGANHAGGAVFGFLMGAIELTALLALWAKFFPSPLVTESLLAGVLLDQAPLLLALLPGEFATVRDLFK